MKEKYGIETNESAIKTASTTSTVSSGRVFGLPSTFLVTKSEYELEMRLSSDTKLVNRVIQKAKGFVLELGFNSFSGINLILRELLINAIEHGNQNDPEKLIICNLLYMRDTLFKITVEDEGKGFDYTSLNMSIPKNSTQIRKRGYPFINAFCEEIEFNAAGNRVSVYHSIYEETHFALEKENERAIITPSGAITASEINAFRSLLKKLTDEGCTQYRFDLSHVDDIDSVGLSAFIILARMLSHLDVATDLEIIHANKDVIELFRMAHIDESYRIKQKAVTRSQS